MAGAIVQSSIFQRLSNSAIHARRDRIAARLASGWNLLSSRVGTTGQVASLNVPIHRDTTRRWCQPGRLPSLILLASDPFRSRFLETEGTATRGATPQGKPTHRFHQRLSRHPGLPAWTAFPWPKAASGHPGRSHRPCLPDRLVEIGQVGGKAPGVEERADHAIMTEALARFPEPLPVLDRPQL